MKGFKENVRFQGGHEEVRAGKTIPYSFIVYSPFVKSRKLDSETEAYLKKYGINLIYVNNSKELKITLSQKSPH
jgi:hypothetical protein